MLTKRNHNCGLCWQERELPDGERVWGHAGNDPGIHNLLLLRRRERTGIVLMTNTNLGPLAGVKYEIAGRLFNSKL